MMMGRQIGNQTEALSVDEGHRVLVRVSSARSASTVELRLRVWDTVKHVKRGCQRSTSIPVRAQQLLFLGSELSNRTTLQALLDSQVSGGTHRFDPETCSFKYPTLEIVLSILPNQINLFGSLSPLSRPTAGNSRKMIERILSGFNRQLNPSPTPEGLSGSYFLRDRFRNPVAIFKPRLEEPFAPQNPKGLEGRLNTSIHSSEIASGKLYLREAAAYLLDENRLFGVPETFLVVVDHPFFAKNQLSPPSLPGFGIKQKSPQILIQNQDFHKTNVTLNSSKSRIGSLQRMVPNNGCISNISVSKISNFEVQKLAILDMRILNADRNDGNILFKRRSSRLIELIPIDHGMSLGSKLSIKASEVVWTGFPQIRKELDPRLKGFVLGLNPEETVKRLSENLDLKPESLAMLEYAEHFLKICVKRGATLFEMSQIYYRQGDGESPSHLERLIESVEFLSGIMSRNKCIDWYTQNKIFDRSARLSGKSLDTLISKMKDSPKPVPNLQSKETSATLQGTISSEIPDPRNLLQTQPFSSIPKLFGIGLKGNELRRSIEICSDFFSPRTFLSKRSPNPKRPQRPDQEVIDFSLDFEQPRSKVSFSTKHEEPPLILDEILEIALSNSKNRNSNVRVSIFNHFENQSYRRRKEVEKLHPNRLQVSQICKTFIDSGDLHSDNAPTLVRARRRLFSEQKPESPKTQESRFQSPVSKTQITKPRFESTPKQSLDFESALPRFEFPSEVFQTPEKPLKLTHNLDKSGASSSSSKTQKTQDRLPPKARVKLPFRSAQKSTARSKYGLKRSLSMCELFGELDDFRESSKATHLITSSKELGEVRHQVKTREARDQELLQRKLLKLHFFCSSLEQFLDAWFRNRPLAKARRKYTAPMPLQGL